MADFPGAGRGEGGGGRGGGGRAGGRFGGDGGGRGDREDRGEGRGNAPGGPMEALEGLPKYTEEGEKCRDFLMNFVEAGTERRKYQLLLLKVANREELSVPIDLDDLVAFNGDEEFATRVESNAQRYLQVFSDTIGTLLSEGIVAPTVDLEGLEDVYDVLVQQRQQRLEAMALNGEEPNIPDIPAALTRRFEVRLLPRSQGKAVSLREVRAVDIGHLVKIKGIVTRVSDVKPMLTVVTYTCDQCGVDIYQEIGRVSSFTPVTECGACRQRQMHGQVTMQTRGSRFVKYQELRVQELPDQVPMGHIPRTMVVHCSGDTTRLCGPGDMVTISGIFLPTKYVGFKALRAGLIADTYLEAMNVFKHKKTYDEFVFSEEMEARIASAAEENDVYDRLAKSIAPEIYGHLDVKKALLLQLVGAPFRKLKDGMKIRGDINIILMGDPGVAKSQLIKYIARVAPRGVYTTGKGSSGVGLTAAVLRDPVTGDMSLEGGALVMADMGICCIDEFDKMDENDRTAIHEVMEQQTVSIAKAGITTTLNARCSVLAAANPLFGRYNKNRTMSENINLPNSLLSRFDLVFLILDRANAEKDMALARHVAYVHRNLKNPEDSQATFDSNFLKHYVAEARQFEPHVPKELTAFIVNEYVQLRSEAEQEDGSNRHQKIVNDQTTMTPRQLLSILRLSQALARLRFSNAVSAGDVEEAIRLTRMSKASLLDDENEDQDGGGARDDISRIYMLIRDYMMQHKLSRMDFTRAEAMVVQKGWSTEQLNAMLELYEANAIFNVSPDRTYFSLNNN